MAYLDNTKTKIITKGLEYPESPVYCEDGSVLLVEVKGEKLTRVLPNGDKETVANIKGGPNGVAIGPDEDGVSQAYVLNSGGFEWSQFPPPPAEPQIWVSGLQPESYIGGRVQKVSLDNGAVTDLFTEATKAPNFPPGFPDWNPPIQLKGLDDGIFDADGGLWITDFGKQRARDKDVTGIYYMAPGGSSIRQSIFPINSPNGIVLSPDGKWLYIALSWDRRVVKYEVGPGGTIKPNPKTTDGAYLVSGDFAGGSMLDSMRADSEGNLYVITMVPEGYDPSINGGVTVVSPEGETLDYIEIASPDGAIDPIPSSICFGGEDLKTAYITCGGSGYLLSMPAKVPGLIPNFAC